MIELSLEDKFKHYLIPKLNPLQNYVQISYNREAKRFQVMMFNPLPRKLRRMIPRTFLGHEVVQRVIGSGNVVTTAQKKKETPKDEVQSV